MFNNQKILSVITARKGSKGIKNKNIKEFMGEPLFVWSVLASLESKYIDKTVISSDSEDIEHIYLKKVLKDDKWKDVAFIKRPKELSGDLSKNEEALIHAYYWMKEINKNNDDYDIICNLQPTSPVRSDRLLDKCIEEYDRGGYDSLLTSSIHTPFLWKKINNKWVYLDSFFYLDYKKKNWQENKQWQFEKLSEDCCKRKMRQQMKNLDEETSDLFLHDCGNIYLMNTKILLDKKCRIGYNPCVFPVDKLNSLQIDTEFDFNLIEQMLKVYNYKSPIERESYGK